MNMRRGIRISAFFFLIFASNAHTILDFSSPQVMKKASVLVEEYNGKRNEGLSSLHSSPTMSPQGSQSKVGLTELPDCRPLNLPGSLSSLTSEAKVKVRNKSMAEGNNHVHDSFGIAAENLNNSDSRHSEIPSRSSIVSNYSVYCMHSTIKPKRQIQSASLFGASENCQPCTSLTLVRNLVTQGSNCTSCSSTEELTLQISEVADSGRGSWTSCSSNSHDNFQSFQVQRMSDMMNHQHPQKADTITEMDDLLAINRHFRHGSELSQSTQSWASSSSVSDRYEGNYSTVKCREMVSQQSTDPTCKTVTSTTEKGLIVYCVTSSCKDDRYKAPPPTPPGYQGLSLGEGREGEALRPAYLKPPNYSVALQRSKLLGDTWRMAAEHHANFTGPAIVAPHAVANSKEDEQMSAV